MINKTLLKEFNDQINAEMYSSYLYLSMALDLESKGLTGFAQWMRVQFEEENFHAMKLVDYVLERNEEVELEKIDKPKIKWESALEIFEDAYKHEQMITGRINNLMNVAFDVKDHAATSFLQWYIDEQVEEESNVSGIVDKLKLIGNNGNGIFFMDKELSTRVFTPPVNA